VVNPPSGLVNTKVAGGSGPAGLVTNGQAGPPAFTLKESLSRIAALTAIAVRAPRASITAVSQRAPTAMLWARGFGDEPGRFEQSMCARVAASGQRLIIDDTQRHTHARNGDRPAQGNTMAWAGIPVRDQAGHVTAVLWAADPVPHHWSADDVALLESLAQLASSEVVLRAALASSAGRAALAQTLEESLFPPRLPSVPGLDVAARHAAAGTGTDAMGDFFDVFPSVGTLWAMVVGDVCGKGPMAAKSAALARNTLRATARRVTRPARILADLNQALLDWPTDDPRFLTAIYASARLISGGALVRISSAGHPLALVRSAHGDVHEFGRPGTLLGVLPDPELHDSQRVLRTGDSLILFSDGVTEARRGTNRELYGDERLRELVAGLGDLPAMAMAETIRLAVLAFSGNRLRDDMVVLVMKVPAPETHPARLARPVPFGARSGSPEIAPVTI
jgi:sigma-B regulation protein RsbU (phosphoserine phosphatase)